MANYRQLAGRRQTLTLEPVKRRQRRHRDGRGWQPRIPLASRDYTRNNPDYGRTLTGMREWFSFSLGRQVKTYVLAADVVFMTAIVNTFIFVLVVAPVQGGPGAWPGASDQPAPEGHQPVFRAIYFMPVVVSIVVVSLLWRLIYDGRVGAAEQPADQPQLRRLIPPIDWLGDPDTALGAIIAMSIWQAVGFHMVIWLSGLQTISPTLYEAGAIEGASKWQVFRYITWPGLRNTAVLVLIVITMQAFGLFAQIDVMTNGRAA